jgi:hypothetical protein
MSQFLKRFLIYLIPIISLVFTISCTLKYITNRKLEKLTINKNIKTLIIGDSHAECSFNPSYIDNSINVAQSGECYYYTFFKLQYFLSKESSIKTVVLACSYNNFNSFWDDFLFLKEKTVPMLERYYQILGVEGFKNIMFKPYSWKYMIGSIGFPIKENNEILMQQLKNTKEYIFPFWGNYQPFTKVNINDTIISNGINKTYYNEGKLRVMSSIQKKYFDKIVNLCKSKNLSLILINTPIVNKYKEQIPERFKSYYNKIAHEVANRKLITLLNLSTFPIPDYGFYDPTHLNQVGAEIFSKSINKILN